MAALKIFSHSAKFRVVVLNSVFYASAELHVKTLPPLVRIPKYSFSAGAKLKTVAISENITFKEHVFKVPIRFHLIYFHLTTLPHSINLIKNCIGALENPHSA